MLRQSGFTLVELMVTVAVAAVLTAVAVPGIRDFVMTNRRAASVNALVSALALARSEALKRGQRTSLCRSSDGLDCNGSSWNAGWLVITDAGSALAIDGDDEILLAVSPGVENGFDLQSSVAGLSYNARGQMTFNGATFELCEQAATAIMGRDIVVSPSGRVRVEEKTC